MFTLNDGDALLVWAGVACPTNKEETVNEIAIALAACGGQGDDALGENVQENLEAQAENLDAAADNTANAAEAAALENQADALEAQGEKAEDAIDAADVNASNVNAM